jgi:hypothetical protein
MLPNNKIFFFYKPSLMIRIPCKRKRTSTLSSSGKALNSKPLLSEHMDMKDKRSTNAGLHVSPSSRIHKPLQLPSYKWQKKITVCSRMPKISSSSNTIVPDRSEFLHLLATWFGLGYIIAKKFRAAMFNQCRQEEERRREHGTDVLL